MRLGAQEVSVTRAFEDLRFQAREGRRCCPICRMPGYRQAALQLAPRVTSLDEEPVGVYERDGLQRRVVPGARNSGGFGASGFSELILKFLRFTHYHI